MRPVHTLTLILMAAALAWVPASHAATIGFWTFNDNLLDNSGNNLHGTPVGGAPLFSTNVAAPAFQDPVSGQIFANQASYVVAGSGNGMSVGFDPVMNASSFTLEGFLFFENSSTSFTPLVRRRTGGSPDTGWQFDLNDTGGLRTRFDSSTLANQVTPQAAGNQPNVADSEWHHFAVSYDGSNGQILVYYDYNQIGSRTLSGPITDITDITAGLLIGSANLPAGSLLDGIRFSEGVLGPSEFLQAVPEPGRAMLLAVAALGLLARRRRGGPGH